MPAPATAGTGKAVGQNAASQVSAKLPLDVCRHRGCVRVVFMRLSQPARQVLHQPVQHRALGPATAINLRRCAGPVAAGRVGGHPCPQNYPVERPRLRRPPQVASYLLTRLHAETRGLVGQVNLNGGARRISSALPWIEYQRSSSSEMLGVAGHNMQPMS